MTKQSERRDEQLRNMPDGYVDPARRRLAPRAVTTEPRRSASKPGRGRGRRSRPILKLGPEELPRNAHGEIVVPRYVRLGIMFLALQHSVAAIAKQVDMPESTLYAWFREEGGIEEVREYVAARATVAFQGLIQVTCDELTTRMRDAPTEELFSSFRKMLEVGESLGGVAKKKAESEIVPGGAHTPPVVVQFNSPPSLPQQSVSENAPSEAVDAEVTDVFDD